MTSFVDLHSHSTASDGTFPPAAVVRLAAQCGLSGMALTDHDTIGGIAEAAVAAKAASIDFLPGIEISAEYPHPGTLHILGYGINPESAFLCDMTRQLIEGRDNRNPKIIARLRELGVAITMEEVELEAKSAESEKEGKKKPIGRPHIAGVLLRKGYVNTIKNAFDKYLAPGGSAYFDKERLTPRRALEMIHESGGVPVLAHPVQLRTENDSQLERVIKDLKDHGLEGLEIIHSDHDFALAAKYTQLANRFGLLKTGGSDFHGTNKKDIQLGTANGRRIPREWMDALLERCATKTG